MKLITVNSIKVLYIYTKSDLKLLMRLRNGLSHVQGHKLKHNFTDCLNQIFMCGKDFKSTNHFFLQRSLFVKEKQVLINKIRDNDSILTMVSFL